MQRQGSYSPTATLTSHAEKLSFDTDSEQYSAVPSYHNEAREVKPVLKRSNTTANTKSAKGKEISNKGGGSKKWGGLGYGWGVGKMEKEKEREREYARDRAQQPSLDLDPESDGSRPPLYRSPFGSSSSMNSQQQVDEYEPDHQQNMQMRQITTDVATLSYTNGNQHSRSNTFRSQASGSSGNSRQSGKQSKSGGSGTPTSSRSKFTEQLDQGYVPSPVPAIAPAAAVDLHRRPTYQSTGSSSTLVGSALERKINDQDPYQKHDTTERLNALRELMKKDDLDYYVVPSEDAHGSEYVAVSDKRREWISGFTGSAGVAIISKTTAYLVTDSRYWLQARTQLDNNWNLVEGGSVGGPTDWIDFLVARAKDSRIGIDARMLAHEKAVLLNSQLQAKGSKLFYPPQNLIDLIWKDKPPRSKEPVYVQPLKYTGMEANKKLAKLKDWIKAQPPTVPSYSKTPPTANQMQVGTLISNLACIAWVLNLRGDDIPFNPVFHAYLFVSAEQAILFIDPAKITEGVDEYLKSINVQRREYNDVWSFMRRKEWGDGRIIITPQTSYAISLMLTSYRYTVLPSIIEEWKAVKNPIELEGLKSAYIRDGVAFVRWLAWLEYKMSQGYVITEYEAGWRLTEFRRMGKNYRGLAYENISATGANAALPHYVPHKKDEILIERDTPYLNDSGGQYLDGTCDTTRTIIFDRPTPEMIEAYTRVLQGHIAIDSAVFPEGTTGKQLDVLARKALWKDGLNYMHGTGHGFGSFLNVHEGPHGFSSDVPLVPGHVITNEPGFYKAGHWGMRIESALYVKRVTTKHEFNGNIWLGFERLTCVPIQTKMVNPDVLSKEEKQWIKDHNRRCLEVLEPYLREDKRALSYLKKEASRDIGISKPLVKDFAIDWN